MPWRSWEKPHSKVQHQCKHTQTHTPQTTQASFTNINSATTTAAFISHCTPGLFFFHYSFVTPSLCRTTDTNPEQYTNHKFTIWIYQMFTYYCQTLQHHKTQYFGLFLAYSFNSESEFVSVSARSHINGNSPAGALTSCFCLTVHPDDRDPTLLTNLRF